MANLDANKVRFTRTGAFYEAPLGTPFPTDTSTPLPSAWIGWGYLGPDGPSRSLSSKSSDIKAWQDNETIATINTESSATYTIPAMETRKEIIETVYGSVVSGANGSYSIKPGKAAVRKCFVLETVDPRTLNKVRECWIAEVTEVADSKYTSTDAFIVVPTFKVFGDIFVIDDSLKVTGPTGPTEPTGPTGTISMTVAQGTDANGNTLEVTGTVTGATTDDGVSVVAQPSQGPSDSRTTSVNMNGEFFVVIPVSGITPSGDNITINASTLPDGQAAGSTQFTYTA
jgi:hypothetical protein